MTDTRYLLLSAYACEPGRGSEPGVGFTWLLRLLDRGFNVLLLTRANNVKPIQQHTSQYIDQGQLVVLGIDIDTLLSLKKWGLVRVNVYHLLWQIRAYFFVKRTLYLRRFNVALIWHLTFSGCRLPTFLSFLPVDCLIGPIAGEDMIPPRILPYIGLRGLVVETLRYAVNFFARINPINIMVYKKAKLVLFKTANTARQYQRYCRASEIRFEIGTGMKTQLFYPARPTEPDQLKLIYVGRMLHLKGIRLVCTAFARAINSGLKAQLHFIGSGPEEAYVRRFVRVKKLQDVVHLRGTMPHQDVYAELATADLLLMPSFRDSSGNVVIEALDVGTPVIALDLGGPGGLLGPNYPGLIRAYDRAYSDIMEEFANRLIRFSDSKAYREEMELRTIQLRGERSFERNVSELFSHDLFAKL
jgi:glycosyltransferase involved in cell wall biosynthesis